MQPFTFDQSVIAGLLFLLGLFIGMFFLAGRKWKRIYVQERERSIALEAENDRLGRENREYQSLRHAAERAPAGGAQRTVVDRDRDGDPDMVIRRP